MEGRGEGRRGGRGRGRRKGGMGREGRLSPPRIFDKFMPMLSSNLLGIPNDKVMHFDLKS